MCAAEAKLKKGCWNYEFCWSCESVGRIDRADANYYDNVRHGVERTLDKLGIDYEYEDTEDENYPFGIKKITIYDAEFRATEKELKPLKKEKEANNK